MTNTFLPLRRITVVLSAAAITALAIVGFSATARASAPAQSNWLQISAATSSPSPRYNASMVYDAATGTTVLFGGFNGTQLGETWTWNGSAWTKQSPGTSPPALQGAALAYDAATHNVVLFGGLGSGGPQADTWTWDGSTWTRQLVSGPVARSNATMVYDANTNDVVLFGGKGNSGPLSDTWNWNGTQWTAPSLKNPSPSPRSEQSMAYDSATHEVVVFGGLGTGGPLSDTWTWDGTTWTQQPAANPPARSGAAMFYDSTTSQIVLFGGDNGTTSLADTWTWNGASWSALTFATNPSGRYLSAMAYDTGTNNAILFGGYNGTTSLGDSWSFTAAPSAPLNVRANSNDDSRSVVTWTAPPSTGGAAIYNYDVVATDVTAASRGGQTCSPLGTTVVTVPSSGIVPTTCTVTGLTNGDQYRFAVSAVNSVGTGPSAVSGLVRPATAPQAPTISKVVTGAGQAIVYWTAPANDGGTPVASYRVTASPGGAFCHVPRGTVSCRIGGLQSGVNYTFTMTATNAAGTSPASAPMTGQPSALPGAPFITSKSVAGSSITIRWQAPSSNGGHSLTGYDVYVGTSPSGAASRPLVAVSVNQLFYTFRGRPGQTYFVIVRAVNEAGIGPFSNQVAAVAGRTSTGRLTLPGAPFITTKSVAGSFITIKWQPPASNGGIRLAGYDIYVGSSPNGAAFRPLVSVPYTQFSYLFRGKPGQASYVIVRAVNEVGIGPFSNQVAAVAK